MNSIELFADDNEWEHGMFLTYKYLEEILLCKYFKIHGNISGWRPLKNHPRRPKDLGILHCYLKFWYCALRVIHFFRLKMIPHSIYFLSFLCLFLFYFGFCFQFIWNSLMFFQVDCDENLKTKSLNNKIEYRESHTMNALGLCICEQAYIYRIPIYCYYANEFS